MPVMKTVCVSITKSFEEEDWWEVRKKGRIKNRKEENQKEHR